MKLYIRCLSKLATIPGKNVFTSNYGIVSKASLHTACVANGAERKININVASNQQDQSPNQFETEKSKNDTVKRTEVEKFNSLAENWWHINGECKPLHSMNKLRVQLIRNGLMHANQIDSRNEKGPHMLKGLKILDVGCGGGILSEPLARLGGEIVGIDAADKNIEIAQAHAERNTLIRTNLRYIHGTIEDHCDGAVEAYDAVVASDVLEHVDNVPSFVEKCITCLKPGGSLFFTTINKTKLSYLAGIILAEKVLNLLKSGTHDWDNFVPLHDLKQLVVQGGCSVRLVHGMLYVPVKNEWYWIADTSVNYAIHAVKL